jgi:hypothetical protein
VGWVVDKSCNLHSPCHGVRSEGAGVSRSDLGYSAAFRSRAWLIAENLCLRQQLSVLQRRSLSHASANATGAFGFVRVHQLAQFAPYCEARDGVTVASTGLARLLVLAITAQATEYRSPSYSSVTSGSHPADDDWKSAMESKTKRIHCWCFAIRETT